MATAANQKACIERPTNGSKTTTMNWCKSACMTLATSWALCTNCVQGKSVSQNIRAAGSMTDHAIRLTSICQIGR